MRTLEKIVGGAALALTMCVTGCSTVSVIKGGARQPTHDIAIVRYSESAKPNLVKAKTDEDLLNNLTKISNVIDEKIVEGMYQKQVESIYQSIRDKKYGLVENKVRSLVKHLNSKNDKKSKILSEKLKNLTYIKYEYISKKYKVSRGPSNEPLRYIASGIIYLFGTVTSPISAMEGRGMDHLKRTHRAGKEMATEEKEHKIKDAHYRKILVNPYHGTEKVLDNHVSLSEVNRIQKRR